LLSAVDIVNHMIFIMLAARDTLTSSFASLVYRLAADPHWQEKVRAELSGLGIAANGPLAFDQLGELPLEEMAFNHCRGAPCATLNSKASDPGWHWCRHQSTLYAFHAGDLARSGSLRSPTLRSGSAARAAQICLRAVWRRCAYVFGAELRQHAGEMFQLAFPQQCGGFHCSRLSPRVAHVANSVSTRRIIGDTQSGLNASKPINSKPPSVFKCVGSQMCFSLSSS
jgi:hypothetical protein